MTTAVATITDVVEDIVTRPDTLLTRKPVTGPGTGVFIADADTEWQQTYRRLLSPIVGLENVTIVGDYTQSLNGLKPASAYIVDPALPMTQGKPLEDYGIDIIEKIKKMEGDCDAVWVLSENHDLLRIAESKEVKNVYTKRLGETEKYPTSDVFVRKIVEFLESRGSIGSDSI